MLGYIVFFIFLFYSLSYKSDKKKILYVFIVISTFSAIRYGIGMDYYTYWNFAQYGDEGVYRFELIPRYLCLFSSYWGTPVLFFLISSIIISIFFLLPIYKHSTSIIISTIFYICFPFFFMDHLGIIRQGMACALVFYSITMYYEKRIFQFLLIIVAFLCHRSALAALLILLPWNFLNKQILWFLFIGSFLIGDVIFQYFSNYILVSNMIFSDDFATYLDKNSLEEGQKIKYLIYFICLLFLLLYDKVCKKNDFFKYLLALIIIGGCIYALLIGISSSMAKRLCIFFFSTSIILIPELIKSMKISRKMFYIVMLSIFVVLLWVDSANKNARIEDKGIYSAKYPYRTIFNK